jgi:hypothetical protein
VAPSAPDDRGRGRRDRRSAQAAREGRGMNTICARCGHPADWHRHDDEADSTPPDDPACPFRCLGYDCDGEGPPPPGGRSCECPNYVAWPS